MSNLVPWPLRYCVAVGFANCAKAVFLKGSALHPVPVQMGSD